MSAGVIIVIVVVAVIAIALIAVALPRMRANARERELVRRRGEVADAHREHASARADRAEEAELIAAKERAEAELHENRARLHERGLADDDLDAEHERLGADREGQDRFAAEEHERTIPPEERTTPR